MSGPSSSAVVADALHAASALHARVAALDAGPLLAASAHMARTLKRGGRVLVFGNGGSAAESQHFAAELVGRFARERRAVGAIALTTDTSILTALANDYAFERIFARQVEALGQPGDVALGISTSGDSPNVLHGLAAASTRGLTTVGLTGRDGGAMKSKVDFHINVPDSVTARVQEVQLTLLHVMCELIERDLVAEGPAEA